MQKNSIQFFGLPGSGKTFYLNKLLVEQPNLYKKVPSFSKIERLRLTIIFVFYFPKISLNFFFLIIQNNLKLWAYIFHLTSVSFAAHMYTILEKTDEAIFLIDEGVLQRLLSVSSKSFSEKQAFKLVNELKKIPSKIIIMQGGDFSRFVSEPDKMISPRNKLGEDYFRKWSDNLKMNFKLIEHCIIKSNHDYKIIEER